MTEHYNLPHSRVMQDAFAHARSSLAAMLAQCTSAQQDIFNRMYPQGVDGIELEKLDWALKQVETTLAKNAAKAATHEAIRLADGFPPN